MSYSSYSALQFLRMAAKDTRASDALEEAILTLDSEFTEVDLEYGADLQEDSIVGDDEISIVMPDEDCDPNVSTNDDLVEVEGSETDVDEDSKIQKFLSDTCKCHLGKGNKPCCLTVSSEDIRKCRISCSELLHNELDLVVMSQVHYFRSTLSKSDTTDSFRPLSSYFFHGLKICPATFLFMHCISRNRYLRIVELYKNEGLTVSKHGNTGRLPKHTCTFEQVQEIKTFIENYACAHGLRVPGRLPNTKDKVILLPSIMSKMFVFRKYSEASLHDVRKSKFMEIWSQLTPHVAVMKPASDLCFVCQQNNR